MYNPATRRASYLKHKIKQLEYSKIYNLKNKFGLTKEDYLKLLDLQKGVCAICFKTCTRSLAVDHNHQTGRIRGLLCNNCNRALGHFKDSIVILDAAITYLKETQ